MVFFRRCDLVVPADWGWGRSNEPALNEYSITIERYVLHNTTAALKQAHTSLQGRLFKDAARMHGIGETKK
jgi:hypothetical protein